MHEFSVCRAVIGQVETLARRHKARRVSAIRLQIGVLAGIEITLLKQAFPFTSANTCAAGARLEVELLPARIRCQGCGKESVTLPNQLCCKTCGNWRTELVQGHELLLLSVELEQEEIKDDV